MVVLNTIHYSYPISNSSLTSPSRAIITILLKASRTTTRKRLPRLHHERTPQAGSPAFLAPLARNTNSIRNNARRLSLRILQLRRGCITCVRKVEIREIHNRDLARIVAAEECSSLIQSLCDERFDGWNEWHACEAVVEGLHVGCEDLGAVGEVIACICSVVVYKNDGDVAGGLEEGEDGVVLESFAAVD